MASRMRRRTRILTISRPLLAASPWSIWTARIIRSSSRLSTASGKTSCLHSNPPWPGRLLDLNYSDPVTLKSASSRV